MRLARLGVVAGLLSLSTMTFLSSSQAAFPGLNGLIVVEHESGPGFVTQIALLGPSGGFIRDLTTAGGENPSWSPNGLRLAFDRHMGPDDPSLSPRSPSDVFVMSLNGGDQTNLTNSPADDSQPAWSPDGSRIVFVSDRNANQEGTSRLFIMNADGSGVTPLTTGDGLGPFTGDVSPSWSPDGSKVVFARGVPSDFPGASAIFVINADGSGLKRLTKLQARTIRPESRHAWGAPAWSPDGSKIIYVQRKFRCRAASS